MDVGSVTAAGDHTFKTITAGAPPTVKAVPVRAGTGVYAPGQVRLSSSFVNQRDSTGTLVVGWAVLGDVLYRSDYLLELTFGQYLQQPQLIRVGGGWSSFKLVEQMEYLAEEHGQTLRESAYGLRNDGTLFRWRVDGLVWHQAAVRAGSRRSRRWL